MAKYVIDSSTLTDIANAIREENTWIFDEIPTEEMSTEIRNLQNGHLDIGQNGTYNVKGMGSVDVAVPSYPEPTGSTTITENGTYNVKDFAEALVNVAGGGGGISGYRVAHGSFTMQEDWNIIGSRKSPSVPFHNPYEIVHDLGKVPDIFYMIDETGGSVTTNTCESAFAVMLPATTKIITSYYVRVERVNGSTNNTGVISNPYYQSGNTISDRDKWYVSMNESSIFVGDADGATTATHDFILRAGRTYSWIALAREV